MGKHWKSELFLALVDLNGPFLSLFFVSGTIVSVGDPKKKYTRYEKIGQG